MEGGLLTGQGARSGWLVDLCLLAHSQCGADEWLLLWSIPHGLAVLAGCPVSDLAAVRPGWAVSKKHTAGVNCSLMKTATCPS